MFRLFTKSRQTLYKWLLGAFLGVMAIGMVITLAPIGGGDTSQVQANVLATIGSTQVTTDDLQRMVQSQLRNSPAALNPKYVSSVATSALDEMVIERAMGIEAQRLGIQVTPQELAQALQTIPWLYNNGKFIGVEAYQNQIQETTGLTVPQFESQLRQRMLLDKVRSIVTDGVTVTPAEVHDEFVKRNAKAKIDYVTFDSSQFMSKVEVTPAALEDYFKKNAAAYKVPEERRVNYVLIAPDRVRAQLKLDDTTLHQYYAQHLSTYRVPERVKCVHILFMTTGKSPTEVTTIENTAKQVLAQVKSGADFGELAKKYSQDPGSAQKGGELGWVVRGQTVKEFENAAFSMKPGQVSDLVKTIYGFHIIKVEDKQNAHLQTFDEVKNQISTDLERQQTASAEQALAQQVENELKANPKEDMAAAASKFGLEAQETPLFKYNDVLPDFGSSESFSNLAFQLHVHEAGEPIAVPKGLAVIQCAEIVPEHIATLDEVRASVEQAYRRDQSLTLAADKAKEFAAKAKSGGDFKQLAKAAGVEVKESQDFTRQDSVGSIPGSQLPAAFTLEPGQTGDPVSIGQALTVVFRVVSHTPANEADFASQQSQIAEELLERKRMVAFEIYQQNLKEQMLRSGELKMNDAALKQFLAQYQNRS
ncbi:MAG TPA: peptidyl-prolyl cis-trans isomerase [Terriglobia bacterium]|nr:peptidyl-prolyl cis-trans isomerase [Terriglobia bacterium]